MMKMYFHFGYDDTILFEFWKPSSALGMLLAVVIVGAIALSTEASIYLNRVLVRRERKKNICHDMEMIVNGSQRSTSCQPSTSHDPSTACQPCTSKCPPSPTMCPPSPSQCPEKCFKAKLPRYGPIHFLTSFIYGYQTILNILLMLSFMTYNVWLCLAVVIGRVIGYACFHGR